MKLFLNYLVIAILGLGLAACNETGGESEEETTEESSEDAAMKACEPGCEMACCIETSDTHCDKSKKSCPMMGSSSCMDKAKADGKMEECPAMMKKEAAKTEI